MPDSPSYSNKSLDKYRTRASRPEDMEVLSETMRTPAELSAASEPSVEALLAQAKGTLKHADETERDIYRQQGAVSGNTGYGPLPLRGTDIARGALEMVNPFGGGFELDEGASRAEKFGAGAIPFLTSGGPQMVGSLGSMALRGGSAALRGVKSLVGGYRAAKTAAQLAEQYPRVMAGSAALENAIVRPTSEAVNALARMNARGAAAERGAMAARGGAPNILGVEPRDFVDFGGRTNTGWAEGAGGLKDVVEGKVGRYPAPAGTRAFSEVDDLARQAGLSGDAAALDDLAYSGEAAGHANALPPGPTVNLGGKPMQSKEAFDQAFRRQLEASAAQGNGPQSVAALKEAVAPKVASKTGAKSAKGAAQKTSKSRAKTKAAAQPPLNEVLQAILEQARQ